MKTKVILLIVSCLGMLNLSAASFKLGKKGVIIDHGTDGSFTLSYPNLVDNANKENKILDTKINGNNAAIKYEKGGELKLQLKGAKVHLAFSGVPANTKKFHCSMIIPSSYKDGGKWSIGSKKDQTFPIEKPAKPFLYQGSATTLKIVNQYNIQTAVSLPQYTFQQLQDNREWGWQVYQWQFWTPYAPNNPNYQISLSAKTPKQDAQSFRVDRFGQGVNAKIVNRIKDERDLKNDVEAEKTYYGSFNPPETDRFGGLPGSKEKLGLKETGFFHVEKKGDRWVLVDPEGNAFFHLGICGFNGLSYTYIKDRESTYEWLPPHDDTYELAWHQEKWWNPNAVSFHIANMIKKYGKEAVTPAAFQDRMVDRVRKWGFNSVGAFSGIDHNVMKAKSFPYVAGIPSANNWNGIPQIPGIRTTFDPFDKKVVAEFEKQCSKLANSADDPLIIGRFICNEPTHEAIPRVVPALKNAAVKRRLVKFLQDKYGDIAAFNQAWKNNAKDFPSLVGISVPVITRQASDDMRDFADLFFETYFKLIHDTVRKYDKNHMIIGCRWQTGTANNERLCRIAAKYVDVVSVNYYTYGFDPDFLGRIHQWSDGKPMLLSEFYWTSSADSGLGPFKDVSSQTERGLAYRNYVEQAAATGYVVGIEWFTLIDQPRTGSWWGKYGGERANTGLISVTDRPWKEMLAEMIKTNYDIYKYEFDGKKPYVFDDPRFNAKGKGQQSIMVARVSSPLKIDGNRGEWPGLPGEIISGKRLVHGAEAKESEANFRLAYDNDNLYIYVDVVDNTPMMNAQTGGHLWSGDGLEVFIGAEHIDQVGALRFGDRQLLIGAGKPEGQFWAGNAPEQFPCKIAVVPKVDGKGYTLEAAIPFSGLGFKPAPGKEILFDLAVDNSQDGKGRKTQLMWNGIATNSSERGAWGKAVFGE